MKGIQAYIHMVLALLINGFCRIIEVLENSDVTDENVEDALTKLHVFKPATVSNLTEMFDLTLLVFLILLFVLFFPV